MRVRSASVAVLLAALASLTLTPAAHAAPEKISATSCSKWKSIRTKNNAAGAEYMECDRTVSGHKQTSAALYLWDNKTDGKCAQAYVMTGRTHWHGGFDTTWQKWYGWCSTKHHSHKIVTGWHSGNDVRVRLQTN